LTPYYPRTCAAKPPRWGRARRRTRARPTPGAGPRVGAAQTRSLRVQHLAGEQGTGRGWPGRQQVVVHVVGHHQRPNRGDGRRDQRGSRRAGWRIASRSPRGNKECRPAVGGRCRGRQRGGTRAPQRPITATQRHDHRPPRRPPRPGTLEQQVARRPTTSAWRCATGKTPSLCISAAGRRGNAGGRAKSSWGHQQCG